MCSHDTVHQSVRLCLFKLQNFICSFHPHEATATKVLYSSIILMEIILYYLLLNSDFLSTSLIVFLWNVMFVTTKCSHACYFFSTTQMNKLLSLCVDCCSARNISIGWFLAFINLINIFCQRTSACSGLCFCYLFFPVKPIFIFYYYYAYVLFPLFIWYIVWTDQATSPPATGWDWTGGGYSTACFHCQPGLSWCCLLILHLYCHHYHYYQCNTWNHHCFILHHCHFSNHYIFQFYPGNPLQLPDQDPTSRVSPSSTWVYTDSTYGSTILNFLQHQQLNHHHSLPKLHLQSCLHSKIYSSITVWLFASSNWSQE